MALADKARATLVRLYHEHGSVLLDDPQRCRGLLMDFCPEHRLEGFILASVLREGMLRDSGRSGVSRVVHLADRIERELGFADDVARWSAESWALAIGWVAEGDLLKAVQCPECRASGRADGTWRGKVVVCPQCKSRIAFDQDLRPKVKVQGKPGETRNERGSWLVLDADERGGSLKGQRLRKAINEVLDDPLLSEGDKAVQLDLPVVVAVLSQEIQLVLQHLEGKGRGSRQTTAELLVGVLRGFQSSIEGLRVYTENGVDESTELRHSCDVPGDEETLGEIGFLAFGTEQTGLVFGTNGVYYRNAMDSTQPGVGAILYSDLARDRCKASGLQELTFGGTGKTLHLGGAGVPKATMLQLLSVIHDILNVSGTRKRDAHHA